MLTFRSIPAGGNAKAAAQYYEGLAAEDYYTAGGEPPGVWVGAYADRLDLAGKVVQEGQLLSALTGHHPVTGDVTANNAGAEHKPGYDLTFSIPKSASLVWALSSDSGRNLISQAQQKSVEATIAHAERVGAFRQREGHAGTVKVPHHELLAATYEHSTNRDTDVNLHTHVVVANLAANGKTLDFDSRFKMELGAVYRYEVASRLRDMGFAVERDRFAFKVAGVPDELVKAHSGRTAAIEQELDRLGIDRNSAAGDKAKLRTRQSKQDVDREGMFERVRESAAGHGFSVFTLRRDSAPGRQWDNKEFLREAFDHASTLTDTRLRAAAYVYGQDRVGVEPEKALQELQKSGDLVSLTDSRGAVRWTSREMLSIERGLADFARKLAAEKNHYSPGSMSGTAARHNLSNEQRAAYEHLLGSRYAAVDGIAGGGKSTMIAAAREQWEGAGKDVIGAALAGKAAKGLKDSAGLAESYTVHKLLYAIESGKVHLSNKSVLVVDEAGMVGSRQMSALLKAVEKSGAEIKLVGDPGQLQPVDAGGAFRAMLSAAGATRINTVRRQVTERDREIVKDLASGRIGKAVSAMREAGMLREHVATLDAMRTIAADTVADLKAGKSAIALTGTRTDAFRVNLLARNAARQDGLLTGPDVSFQNGDGHERRMAVGERVMLTRNDYQLGVENGATGRISAIGDGRMAVRMDGADRTVHVDLAAYPHVEHGYAFTTHKAQGITVDVARALIDERMLDRSLGYVQASRHRERFELHGTTEQMADLSRVLSRDRPKDLSTDYVQRDGPRNESMNESSFKNLVTRLRDAIGHGRDSLRDLVKGLRQSISDGRGNDRPVEHEVGRDRQW